MANSIDDLKGFRSATLREYAEYFEGNKYNLVSYPDLLRSRMEGILIDEIIEADYIKQWSEQK